MASNDLTPEVKAAIEAAAEKAAKRSSTRAIKEVLLLLGMNADDPNAILKLQQDMAALRKWRESADSRGAKVGLALIGGLISFAGAVLMLVVQQVFPGAK